MSDFTHPLVAATACIITVGYLFLAVAIVRRALPSAKLSVRLLTALAAALVAVLATLPPILHGLAEVAA